MSTVTEPKKDLAIVQAESAICRCCDGEIPPQNIARNLVPLRRGVIGPTRQTVKAFCDTCDVLYALTRELSGGTWHIIEGVAVVDDPKAKASFKARLSHLKGDIQIHAKEGKHARA